jgi:hypothetical protein
MMSLCQNFQRFFSRFLKYLGVAFLLVISAAFGLLVYINLPAFSANENAKLGVTFSARYAKDINLDWRASFTAVLDDLGARKIRIPVYWDLVQPFSDEYNFSDLDWQLAEAGKRDAEIILVVGQKVPRWPECAIPAWIGSDDQKRKSELLRFVKSVVQRYKDEKTVKYWQVENEPFLAFGICPKFDVNLLDSEIALVRSLDPDRKIIVTDSGELSLWVRAAKRADIFGTTMYRTIWSPKVGYYDYPIGPRFFQVKHLINKVLAGQDQAIVIELQGEPWLDGWTTGAPLEKQFASMDAAKLKDNVEFAKEVGFPEIYLWGVEWWYWLKVEQNHPELWDQAKRLFEKS